MEFITKVPQLLKPYFNEKLIMCQKEYQHHNLKRAFNHLERAHVIGQRYPYEHGLISYSRFREILICNRKSADF